MPFLVMKRRHFDFQLIFNYLQEHLIHVKSLMSIVYTYNRPINEVFSEEFPTLNKLEKDFYIL